MKHQVAWTLAGWLSMAGCVQACTDNKSPDVLTADDLIPVGTLLPDEACVVAPDSTFLLRGTYDVSDNSECTAPYMMALQFDNHMVNENPPGFVGVSLNDVQVMSAQVTLLNVDASLRETGDLPNPFVVPCNATIAAARGDDPGEGIALVEAIPTAYRERLRGLASGGGSVVVAIQLTATSVGGVSVQLTEVPFPVRLCVGCLTLCRNSLSPEDLNDLTDGICKDNSGSDGRFCIVEGC